MTTGKHQNNQSGSAYCSALTNETIGRFTSFSFKVHPHQMYFVKHIVGLNESKDTAIASSDSEHFY